LTITKKKHDYLVSFLVMTTPQNSYDCSALLSHVTQEEAKLSQNDITNFGHPPAPKLTTFRLSSEMEGDSSLLMVAFTKRCISAQVLTRQPTAMDDSSTHSSRSDSSRAFRPFLVCQVLPSTDKDQELIQRQQQHVEEVITALTVVALEDLSLITAAEKNDQVVFDNNPKKKRVQFDEATPLDGSGDDADHATAKIKNLQLRGFVSEQMLSYHFPRIAVIFGTNLSRVMSVEMRWNTETQSIVFPIPEPLDPLPLDPLHLLKKIQEEKLVPFCPLGGVDTISTFILVREGQKPALTTSKEKPSRPIAYVWLSYGDGTILRIHHAAFFQSVVGDELKKPNVGETPTLHERLSMQHIPLLLRCETKIAKKDIASFAIVPMPKYHPSPLAPLPPFKSEKGDNAPTAGVLSDQEDKEDEDDDELFREACEAVLYSKPTASAGTAETFPTLCFYTSEDQFLGRVEGHGLLDPSSSTFGDKALLGAVVGGAKALVGALTWGFGGGASTTAQSEAEKQGEETSLAPVGYFPTLRKGRILKLYAGHEIHDAPRQVESLIIDPDGNLGATTDSFGRVMLLDLSTKQVVRMWKGFREASCCWLQVPRPSSSASDGHGVQKKKALFLVIHSRQRRVVEVYRVRHGPRVKLIQVGRDAQVVNCKEWIWRDQGVGDYVSTCYIIHSNVPGSNEPQILEKLAVEGLDEAAPQESQRSDRSSALSATNPKEAALRLQRLQQLLANTNVPCQLTDVHNALLQIKSLKDLATCLDRLAVASVLESKMGVTGTEFQKTALAYCREALKEAVKNTTGDPASNPNVKLLATQIVYHTQVIDFSPAISLAPQISFLTQMALLFRLVSTFPGNQCVRCSAKV
jgi:Rab3 GTPase-activating protein regulatory subunit N-terminus